MSSLYSWSLQQIFFKVQFFNRLYTISYCHIAFFFIILIPHFINYFFTQIPFTLFNIFARNAINMKRVTFNFMVVLNLPPSWKTIISDIYTTLPYKITLNRTMTQKCHFPTQLVVCTLHDSAWLLHT